MKKASILFILPVILGFGAFAAAPVSLTDESENYRQLQDMPRERRVVLLDNLARFDKLGPAEQAKIRKLNADIAAKKPDEQPTYRSLMRRYELWVSGLTEEQKETLRSTDDPETRFKLALEYRKKELESSANSQKIHGIRSGYYGLKPPFEMAFLLRIWFRLPAAKKTEIERIERNAEKGLLEKQIRDLAIENGVSNHPFPPEEERKYDAILDRDEDFKKKLGNYARRVDVKSKKNDQAKTKDDHPRTRFELRYTEFLYFEEHKPKPVSQQNLERFSAWCPSWFHSMIDSLSADDARNYMTIVYRLIFTDHAEITADWKPTREKTLIIPGTPRPAPKRQGAQPPL